MIGWHWRGLKEAVRDLKRLREKALPYAMRDGLNEAAFQTSREWRAEMGRTFIERSAFVDHSVRVERAQIGRLVAKVGSAFEGLAKQEKGGTVTGKSGRKPIPAPVAAGLAPGSKRTKLVRSRFYLGSIKVSHPTLRGSRKQRNAIALAVARREGQKAALLERPSGGKGLFLLGGGKRKITTKLLWDVSKSSVHLRPTPTLEPTLVAIAPKLEHILLSNVVKQLQRHNIADY